MTNIPAKTGNHIVKFNCSMDSKSKWPKATREDIHRVWQLMNQGQTPRPPRNIFEAFFRPTRQDIDRLRKESNRRNVATDR